MISYNVHKADNDLKGHIQRLAPNVLLVLNNYGLAHDTAVENPHCQVIFRPYFGRDDLYNFMSTNQFISYCRQWWQGEPNIWFHTNNEAGLSPEMQTWEMNVVKIAPAGMKFVLANPATGTFPDSVNGWTPMAAYIKFLVDNKERVMLGLHEYFDVVPVITMPSWLTRFLNWNGAVRPAYHCGRYRWLTDYCDLYLEGQYPKIVITEAGNDDLTEGRDGSDVNAFLATLGFKPRGWQTLKDFWQRLYSVQPDITYFNMFKWLVENVYNHPAIVGLCIFAWTADDAPQWGTFNVSAATNFRNMNEAYHATPAASKHSFVVVSNYTTNVRESGSTLSKILTKVNAGSIIEVYDVMVGDWYHIVANGFTGFVRKDVIEFAPLVRVICTAEYSTNIRASNTTSSNVLGLIHPNDEFVMYGADGDWTKVVCKGIVGYSLSSLLKCRTTSLTR